MSENFATLFHRQRAQLRNIEAACNAAGEAEGRLRRIAQLVTWALDVGRAVPDPINGNGHHSVAAAGQSDAPLDDLDQAAGNQGEAEDTRPLAQIGNLTVLPLGLGFITLVNGSPVQATGLTIRLDQNERPRVKVKFLADEDPQQ